MIPRIHCWWGDSVSFSFAISHVRMLSFEINQITGLQQGHSLKQWQAILVFERQTATLPIFRPIKRRAIKFYERRAGKIWSSTSHKVFWLGLTRISTPKTPTPSKVVVLSELHSEMMPLWCVCPFCTVGDCIRVCDLGTDSRQPCIGIMQFFQDTTAQFGCAFISFAGAWELTWTGVAVEAVDGNFWTGELYLSQ